MKGFICPICAGVLQKYGRSLKCSEGHSFDIARQGYVNLLIRGGQSSTRHGDDRLMVASRTAFLEKGFYNPLRDEAVKMAAEHYTGGTMLDAGCGECWYTRSFAEKFPGVHILGVDISKEAIVAGCRRKCADLAVASVFSLPVCDESCGMIINFFAPFAEQEFKRVLKPGGLLLRAVPLENHLIELKEKIYDKPYLNKPGNSEVEGFILCDRRRVEFKLSLETNEDIMNLFRMTPYYYKTGRSDQAKAAALESLQVTAQFGLLAYSRVL